MSIPKKPFILVSLLFIFITQALFADTVHVVIKGDTLYSLSKKYNVSVEKIIQANKLSGSEIKAGQKLIIPGVGDATTPAQGTTPSQSIAIHTVVAGDTFYSLARLYNTKPAVLYQLNSMNEKTVLKVGMKLKVPAKSVPAVEQNGSNTTPATTNPPKGEVRKYYDLPVEGKVNRLTGKLSGIEIESPLAAEVKASAGGVVVWAAPYRGYGYMVMIETGDVVIAYGGNELLKVKTGDKVEKGQVIARLGVNAHSGTYKLLMLIYRKGKPVDPFIYLGFDLK